MGKGEALDNRDEIKKIDPKGMLAIVSGMPEMLGEAYKISKSVSLPEAGAIKNVVFSGMGGSAIAGDVITDLLWEKSPLGFYTNRGYKVPGSVGEETLFFAVSYSGNTEETILAVNEAAGRKAKIFCLTSGGKLRELAEKNRFPLCVIPSGYQPRAAFPYILLALLNILSNLGIYALAEKDVVDAAAILQKLAKEIGPAVDTRNNPAKQLAKKIEGKIPVILASAGLNGSAGMRMKTQFNENSKVTALLNSFPELNHNEMVNLSALKRESHDFALLLLRDEGEPDRIAKRIEITKSLIGVPLGGVNEIWAKGKTPFARVLSLIFYGDLLSVYLAIARGIDPTSVDAINRFKKEISR